MESLPWAQRIFPLDPQTALSLLFAFNSIPIILSVILFLRAWKNQSLRLWFNESPSRVPADVPQVEQFPEPVKVRQIACKRSQSARTRLPKSSVLYCRQSQHRKLFRGQQENRTCPLPSKLLYLYASVVASIQRTLPELRSKGLASHEGSITQPVFVLETALIRPGCSGVSWRLCWKLQTGHQLTVYHFRTLASVSL